MAYVRMWWSFVVVLAVLAGSAVAADADNSSQKGPPRVKVQLREAPKGLKGKIAVYRGEVDKDGVAFEVEGLGIGVPVAMFVGSHTGAPLKLSVKADASKKWDKVVERDAKTGVAEVRFRTEGTAWALVTSTGERVPYKLVIWTGPEIKFHKMQRSPFVKKASAKAGGAETAVAIAIVAALVLVVVVVIRRRMKKGRAA